MGPPARSTPWPAPRRRPRRGPGRGSARTSPPAISPLRHGTKGLRDSIRRPVLRRVLLIGALAACAHGPRAGDVQDLKKAGDAFHKRARWRDWRGLAELV